MEHLLQKVGMMAIGDFHCFHAGKDTAGVGSLVTMCTKPSGVCSTFARLRSGGAALISATLRLMDCVSLRPAGHSWGPLARCIARRLWSMPHGRAISRQS